MRSLDLDFQRTGPRGRWRGLALLAAAVLVSAQLFFQYRTLNAEADRWEARNAQLARALRQSRTPPAVRADPQRTALEIQRARLVWQQLTLPWQALFAAVESYPGGQVALLAIQPDAQKQQVRISGEARHLAAVLDYVRYLEACPQLEQVLLQKHQLQAQEREQPIRFVVQAKWTVQP